MCKIKKEGRKKRKKCGFSSMSIRNSVDVNRQVVMFSGSVLFPFLATDLSLR